jgi:hypothetical protein
MKLGVEIFCREENVPHFCIGMRKQNWMIYGIFIHRQMPTSATRTFFKTLNSKFFIFYENL